MGLLRAQDERKQTRKAAPGQGQCAWEGDDPSLAYVQLGNHRTLDLAAAVCSLGYTQQIHKK